MLESILEHLRRSRKMFSAPLSDESGFAAFVCFFFGFLVILFHLLS